MELRCDEVRSLMEPAGPAVPLSDEKAEQVAAHLDRCPECDPLLSRQVAGVLGALPVAGRPSVPAVRALIGREQRRSMLLRFAGLAAAGLALAGTGWALLHQGSGSTQLADRKPPVEAPIPDPPKLADLSELDRAAIRSEGVLALYLQFCLTCINDPTEPDKEEFLTRSLLIFREVRGRIREELAKADPKKSTEAVTLNALNDALRMLSTSKLPSVKNAPSKATAFKFLPSGDWQVDHLLGSKTWRLTLPPLPDYLNFAYLKPALGANDALMNRLEEALWVRNFVKLPAKIEDKDPTVAPKALETVLPLLSPRQQAIYRKIVGSP